VRTIAVALASFGIYEATGLPRELSRYASSIIGCIFGAGLIGLCLVVAYHGWFFRTARAVRWLCVAGVLVAFGFALTIAEKAAVRWMGAPLVQSPTHPLNA
jgi:fumarate reductase subunit D